MKPEKLAGEIESLILSVTDYFASEITGIQDTLYNRLIRSLKGLELDSEGYIKQSAANRAILSDAESVIDEMLPGRTFTEAVSNTLNAINTIDSLNSEYFSLVSESFRENRAFLKSLQSQTIKSIESTLLEDGLTAQIKNPLAGILNRNVSSGGQFSGFLQEVRDFVQGNEEVDGRILSYSRTFVSDTFFNYSRSYQESITADLKLDWYLFSGGLMDKSRPFCVEHSGNFYHRKEIEQWANDDWQGKRKGTTASSIFVFLGGYNCRHSLIPVHKSIVPKEAIQRAIEAGYILQAA